MPYAVKKVDSYFNENNDSPTETIELDRIDSVSSESSDIRRTDSYIESVVISGDHLETPVETDEPSNCNDEPESYSYNNEISIDENIILSKKYTQHLRQRKRTNELKNFYTNSFNVDKKADKLCGWLQIFARVFHHSHIVLRFRKCDGTIGIYLCHIELDHFKMLNPRSILTLGDLVGSYLLGGINR